MRSRALRAFLAVAVSLPLTSIRCSDGRSSTFTKGLTLNCPDTRARFVPATRVRSRCADYAPWISRHRRPPPSLYPTSRHLRHYIAPGTLNCARLPPRHHGSNSREGSRDWVTCQRDTHAPLAPVPVRAAPRRLHTAHCYCALCCLLARYALGMTRRNSPARSRAALHPQPNAGRWRACHGIPPAALHAALSPLSSPILHLRAKSSVKQAEGTAYVRTGLDQHSAGWRLRLAAFTTSLASIYCLLSYTLTPRGRGAGGHLPADRGHAARATGRDNGGFSPVSPRFLSIYSICLLCHPHPLIL